MTEVGIKCQLYSILVGVDDLPCFVAFISTSTQI